MLLDDVKSGKVKALIARAADFTGPKNSVLVITVIDNYVKGNSAQMLGDITKTHSFTYVPDAGAATALLGNTEDAYGQVWHLPSEQTKMTWRQWIDLCAKECGVPAKVFNIPRWSTGILSIFIPFLGGQLAEPGGGRKI